MASDTYSAAGIISATIIFEILAISLVCIRFWCRRYKKVGLGADDWLILAALVVVTGFAIIEVIGCVFGAIGSNPRWAHDGAGRASSFFSVPQRFQIVVFTTSLTSQALIKLSAVLLIRRIFQTPAFSHFATAWALLIIVWGTSFLIYALTLCAPNAEIGNVNILICPNSTKMDLAYCISDTVTDFFALAMPLPLIYRLNMRTRTKILVCCFFLLGFVPIGASIGKLVIYVDAMSGVDVDFPYVFTAISLWNLVECQVGIITASLPTVRPFFKRFLHHEKTAELFKRFGWQLSGGSTQQRTPRVNGSLSHERAVAPSIKALIRKGSTPSKSETQILPQTMELDSFDHAGTIDDGHLESGLPPAVLAGSP